ncbi:alpha/beta hydrolase [Mesorhizobium loti]|nr:alpha/beta hydrolase [Mesorhizobium loti]
MEDLQAAITGSVRSRDGTTIGYRQMGSGPGLVLLHGAMQSSHNFTDLAAALSDTFSVYIPDRRGRGLSGPHGDGYALQKEVEDLDALLGATDSINVFGLSSGAIITLAAALAVPSLRRIALFEPPLDVGNVPSPQDWVPGYEKDLARGDLASAMVTAMKGTDPSLFTALPRLILVPLIRLGLRAKPDGRDNGKVPLDVLIRSVHFDACLVAETVGMLERFKAVNADVLLLGGTRSVSYLPAALDALQGVLPTVKRRVAFQGLGHLAADNDGQPKRVANELRNFFLGASVSG